MKTFECAVCGGVFPDVLIELDENGEEYPVGDVGDCDVCHVCIERLRAIARARKGGHG